MEQKTGKSRGLGMLAAAIIVAALLLAVYAMDGIWPFGTGTVAHGDMENQYVPYYTYLWDVIHGNGSLLFSWSTGCGMDFWGTVSQYSLLSPLNLLFYLVPRDGMLTFMSLFVIIKLSLCAASSAWFFGKRFPKLSGFYPVFLGVAYGLSGYVLMQYHNIMWMDMVALTPLLLYAAERLLQGGKVLPYVALLAGCLIINLYISAMLCLFILLAAGAYILLLVPRGEKGRAVLRIGAATAAALLLSAFITLPAAIRLFSSQRAAMNTGAALFGAKKSFHTYGAFAMCGLTFAAPICLGSIVRCWRRGSWRGPLFLAFCIGIVTVPLWFPGIDAIWHLGGNISFPYRYGFLAVFAILAASGAALETWEPPALWDSWPRWWRTVRYIAPILVFIVFCGMLKMRGDEMAEILGGGRRGFVYFTAAALLLYTLLLLLPQKPYAKTLLLLSLCAQMGVYGLSFFRSAVELPTARTTRALALKEQIPDGDPFARVKSMDASLGSNSGPILGRGSVAEFCSSYPEYYLEAVTDLGYSRIAQSTSDTGGTLFSDALINLRYRIYGDADGHGKVTKTEYALPFGIVGDKSLLNVDPGVFEDPAGLQNALFTLFTGDEELLLTPLSLDWTTTAEGLLATGLAQGKMCLYLCDTALDLEKPVQVYAATDAGEQTIETAYPRPYQNGLLDLGSYRDESITLRLTGDGGTPGRFRLYGLDETRLGAYCDRAERNDTGALAGNRSLTLQATAERDGEVLFLPMTYLTGWRCQVDGESQPIHRVVGTFVGVELAAGTHRVELTYLPDGMALGICMSVVGLLLTAGICLLERRKALFSGSPGWLNALALGGLVALWGAVVAALYVYTVLYGFWLDFLFQTRY